MFESYDELTLSDLHQMILMICPDFPYSLLEESVFALDPVFASTPSKFAYGDLKIALFFHVLYAEWLADLMKLFLSNENGSNIFVSVQAARLQQKIQNWIAETTLNYPQPPREGIEYALQLLSVGAGKSLEISYEKMLQTLFSCQILQDDVCAKPAKATSIVQSSSLTLLGASNSNTPRYGANSMSRQLSGGLPPSGGTTAPIPLTMSMSRDDDS